MSFRFAHHSVINLHLFASVVYICRMDTVIPGQNTYFKTSQPDVVKHNAVKIPASPIFLRSLWGNCIKNTRFLSFPIVKSYMIEAYIV